MEKMAYSSAEVAEVLGVSRPTVYNLLKRIDFPSFKIGTRTLVPVDGLREWIAQQAKGGNTLE